MTDTRTLIEQAVALLGSEAKLGKAAGVTQNAIWQAKRRGRCSAELALGIHRATSGQVPASGLRSDLWPTARHVPGFPPQRVAS